MDHTVGAVLVFCLLQYVKVLSLPMDYTVGLKHWTTALSDVDLLST